MKRLLSLIAFTLPLFGAKTHIVDHLYLADGSSYTGNVAVSWTTSFTSSDGHVNYTGTLFTVVTAGALDLYLEPNDTATPSNTFYIANYNLRSGIKTPEFWIVPTSATPVTLADIRTINAPSPGAAVPLTSLSLGGASVGQCLLAGASVWAPGNCVLTDTAGHNPLWVTYTVTAIANAVNGCANANGCWQVSGVLGANKTAGLTQNLAIFQLPAKGYVQAFRIKSATACTGASTLVTGLGTASSTSRFLNSAVGYDLKAAVSATNFNNNAVITPGSDTSAAVNIVASLVSTGSNIDQIAAGCSFGVSVLYGVLP